MFTQPFIQIKDQKKTSKLRVTGLCAGNSPGTGEFPHKWPVTRKMFPFDDVIMECVDADEICGEYSQADLAIYCVEGTTGVKEVCCEACQKVA